VSNRVIQIFAVLAIWFASPAQATQISITGSCNLPAVCSFAFSGDTRINGDLENTEVDPGFFVLDPEGVTTDTALFGEWTPDGDFGQFSLGVAPNRVRIDFTSFVGSVETGGTGMFAILQTPPGSFVPFLDADGNPIVGEFTVTAVPLPAAAWLFLSALLGLGVISRRRTFANAA